MPDLPESLPLLVTAGKGAKGHGAPAITPPPSHSAAVAAGQSEVVVGMARSQSPNSANSQFFIMFDRNESLDGGYTVWGRVVDGMQHVDNIKLGSRAANGKVDRPDSIIRAWTE